MAEELFDVVDAEDRVIDRLPRSVVHARGLLHRAVSVFVFNAAGRLLLQMRSATKDEYPRCWTSSASGHLGAGEEYDDCAPRELVEETGLTAPLERLAKFPASAETANEHTVLYRAATDQRPTFDAGEVAYGAWFSLEEIDLLLAQTPEQFTPPFRTLYQWYRRNAPATPGDSDDGSETS